jgi:amino-acid N-acetyltransferase
MIRKATLHDIPGILELVNANLGTLLPRTYEDYAELIETTYIFEKDGRIVGSCVLEIYSPKIAEIRTVIVHESARGMGFGSQLVKVAADDAERQNIREVMVVTSSPEYFTKLGFGECLHEKWALFYRGSKGSKQS